MKLSHLLPVAAACAMFDGCGPATDSKVVRANEPEAQREGRAVDGAEPEPQYTERTTKEVEGDYCRAVYENSAVLGQQMAVRVGLAACLVSGSACSLDLSGRLPVSEMADCWEDVDGAPGNAGDCEGNNPKSLSDCVAHEIRTSHGASSVWVSPGLSESFVTLSDCNAALKRSGDVNDALGDIVVCLRSVAEDDLMPLPPTDIPDEIIPQDRP